MKNPYVFNLRKIRLPLLISFAFFVVSCASKPFNLVLLPDTQTYTRLYPDIFIAQTQWVSKNADSIAFVLHQGDITGHNTDKEWQIAISAFHLLDRKVPYTFVAGNHDIGGGPGEFAKTRLSDLFNMYLPFEKYSNAKSFGGAFEYGKMDNTWHILKSGGLDWLIISLEFGPRNKVLKWANEIVRNHPGHLTIINTHAYMYSDNTRMDHTTGHRWVPGLRYRSGRRR